MNVHDSVLSAAGILAQLGLNVALPLAMVRADLRRLPREKLERAWPDTTLLSATVAFGPLCLPVYYARTRGLVRGSLVGLWWTACVLLLTMGAGLLGLP